MTKELIEVSREDERAADELASIEPRATDFRRSIAFALARHRQSSTAALRERVEALEKGLEPFALAADRINGDIADAVNIWPGSFPGEWFTGTKPLFNASDLRTARSLLSERPEHE